MYQVLTTVQRRQLEIIEYLYFVDDWVKIEQISSDLNYSTQYIKQDINALIHEFHIDYLHESSKGIRFYSHNNVKLDTIYQEVLLETPDFQIIDHLLYQPIISLEDLAEKLSTDLPTIKDMIEKLNIGLKEQYNISLKDKPVTFTGSETNIRSFIFQYFIEKYKLFDWPFENMEQILFEEFVIYFNKLNSVSLDYTQLEYVKIFSMISLIRYKQGYSVRDEFSYRPKEFWERLFYNLQLEGKQSELEEVIGLPITKDLLINLFFPFIQKEYAFSFKNLLDKFQYDKNVASSIYTIEKMLIELSTKYNLTMENHYELILELHNAYYLKNMQTESNYALFDRKKHFCIEVKQLFPKFYEDAKAEIMLWTNSIGGDESKIFIEHLIYVLFTQWENLVYQLLNSKESVKMLVFSKYDAGHAKMMSDIIKHNIDNQVDMEVYSEKQLDYKQIKDSDYDIIITPFPMDDIEGKKIIYITNFPNKEDIQKIKAVVGRLYFN